MASVRGFGLCDMSCVSPLFHSARRMLLGALIASSPMLAYAAGQTLETALMFSGVGYGQASEARLPHDAEAASSTLPVAKRYRWTFDLGQSTPHGWALYWTGLIGHPRIWV